MRISIQIQIGIEIAQGLDYMHTRDPAVIHQDIKPENIMVSIITSTCISLKFVFVGCPQYESCIHL